MLQEPRYAGICREAGRTTGVTLPDGIKEEYGYDAAGENTAIAYKHSGSTLGAIEYAYDANGQVEAMWGSYARLNLPGALKSAEYNADNELVKRESAELEYDKDGNLLNDGANEYSWNARGQLTGISGEASASFGYDPFGRRTSKTLGATTTELLYDEANVALESQEGTTTASLLFGLRPDQLFARTTGSGTDSYLTDRLGSTIALANASAELTTTYSYEPFGASTSTGAESDNPYQFTGRENDGTGLQYNRARYYSFGAGRFISPDPAGFAGSGTDLYWYGYGDPVDVIDPSGELSISISIPDPIASVEHAVSSVANQVGNWVSEASAVVSEVWDTVGSYVNSCLSNAIPSAVIGAGFGAVGGGVGAAPGAVSGAVEGCGVGVAEQALRDAGVPEAAELVGAAAAVRNISKGVRIVGRNSPELGGQIKDVVRIFY
jgi:RHS repeat-associated protein